MVPNCFSNFWSSKYYIMWRESEHKSWQFKWSSWACEGSIDHLQFAIWYCWWIPSIIFLKYLFTDTYKATHRHLWLQLASLDHRLVLFTSHENWLELDNSKPAGTRIWISWTKSGYTNILLRSIDKMKKCLINIITSHFDNIFFPSILFSSHPYPSMMGA